MRWIAWIPAFAATACAADFWVTKPPAEWTGKEALKVATSSPWARKVIATKRRGGDDLSMRPAGERGRGRQPGFRTSPDDETEGATLNVGVPDAKAVVRWESATPVREAGKRLGQRIGLADEAFQSHYVVSLSLQDRRGKSVDWQIPRGEGQRAAFVKWLGSATTLEHRGKGIHRPEKIGIAQTPEGTMLLFYFPRSSALEEAGNEVTFTTRMWPVQYQAKFKLKRMKFGGKLEL